jgi:hypothetical protein
MYIEYPVCWLSKFKWTKHSVSQILHTHEYFLRVIFFSWKIFNLFLQKKFVFTIKLSCIWKFRLFCYFWRLLEAIQGMHHNNSYPKILPKENYIFTKKFCFGMLLSCIKFQVILLLFVASSSNSGNAS